MKLYLFCLVLFGLFGCSPETVVLNSTESVNKTTLDKPSPSVETTIESPVKVVGNFINIKDDGEHAYGYSVMLWTHESKICGLISGSDDLKLSGDPPAGLLENVEFDSNTNRFSFRAKLPSNIYKFEGILTDKKLTGKQTIIKDTCSDGCPQIKTVTLNFSEDLSSLMNEYKSYSEWKEFANEILVFRGPKKVR